MIKNYNSDRIREIVLILKDKESMNKSELKKALDMNGATWTLGTVFQYLNYLESKNIVQINKKGRTCSVSLSEKGKSIVKHIIIISSAFK